MCTMYYMKMFKLILLNLCFVKMTRCQVTNHFYHLASKRLEALTKNNTLNMLIHARTIFKFLVLESE